MPRLSYIANLRLPTEKGYGFQIAKMCEAFGDSGLTVTLLTPYRRSLIKENFFDYYSIRNNFEFKKVYSPDFYFPGQLDKISFITKSFLAGIVLVSRAIRQKPDFFYSRDELVVFLLSFFTESKKIIFESHRFSEKKRLFYNRFKNKDIKLVTLTKGMKTDFIEFGFKENNILVAHDGVDIKEFDIKISKENSRDQLGLPKKNKLIGYVGSFLTLGMDKGVSLLLESLKSLKDNDIKLVLVGGSADINVVNKYKNLVGEMGLTNRVIFVGQVSHNLIPVYLKAFDILTLPLPPFKHYSVYASPLKLFEYMSSDRPVIASDLPAAREVLGQDNAVLFKAGDSESLTHGIKSLLLDETLSARIAGNALKDVRAYSWLKRAENIKNFIRLS